MRLISTLLVLVGALALNAEDIIILKNQQRISGTIVEEVQADDHLVSIDTGSGILRFNRDFIDRVIMSYASRRAQVKETDAEGLVALAKWCRSKGMNIEALDLLEKALALPTVDAAARVMYLRLIDEIRGPEVALPLYKAYRDAGGDDANTLERLAQLEKVKADYDAQYGTQAANQRLDFSREGLEMKAWMPESPQYFNPVDVERVTIDATDGPDGALRLTCKAGANDKAAIRLGMGFSAAQQNRLQVTISVEGKIPLRVGMAVKTGSQYVYHESEAQVVPGGNAPTTLSFDLKSKTWKSEASKWQSNGTIADLDQVREIQLLFHNGSKPVTVLVNQIAFQGIKDL